MNNAEKVKYLLEAMKHIASEASKSKPSRLKIKEVANHAINEVENQ
jgi:hypothetical protein